MTRLALTLSLMKNETPASYVSRLSRKNLTLPREFCSDLGMHWPHICSAHEDQLQRLSYLSGVTLDDIRFSAAPSIAPGRYKVGFSEAGKTTLRRAMVRICPQCTVEAFERHGWLGAHQRLDWLLQPISVCQIHGVPLLQLPNAQHSHKTYDAVGRVKLHFDTVKRAADAASHLPPTSFETYLYDRAFSGAQTDWLATLDLTELHQSALALGRTILFGASQLVSDLTPADIREAMDVGHKVLVGGSGSLQNSLDAIRLRHQKGRRYFTKDIGPLYWWLRSKIDSPNLFEIRECVETYVLRHYPLKTGKPVLAATVKTPEALSWSHARELIGIGPARIKDILAYLDKKDISEYASMNDLTKRDFKRVKSLTDKLVGLTSAAETLNVHHTQIDPLLREGVLKACSFGSSVRYVERASVENLLRKIENLPDAKPNRTLLPLGLYCQLERVPLAKVVAEWLNGNCNHAYRNKGERGLQRLTIDRGAQFEARKFLLKHELTLIETSQYLRVGIGAIRLLRDEGFLEVIERINANSNRLKTFIPQRSIRKFEKSYITLGQLVQITGRRSIHLARWLDQQGLEPIQCRTGQVRVYGADILGQLGLARSGETT